MSNKRFCNVQREHYTGIRRRPLCSSLKKSVCTRKLALHLINCPFPTVATANLSCRKIKYQFFNRGNNKYTILFVVRECTILGLALGGTLFRCALETWEIWALTFALQKMQDKRVYLSQEMSAEQVAAQVNNWDAVYSATTLVILSSLCS